MTDGWIKASDRLPTDAHPWYLVLERNVAYDDVEGDKYEEVDENKWYMDVAAYDPKSKKFYLPGDIIMFVDPEEVPDVEYWMEVPASPEKNREYDYCDWYRLVYESNEEDLRLRNELGPIITNGGLHLV